MHVAEMEEREPFQRVLRETLEVGLSEYCGLEQIVSMGRSAGQHWSYLPLFSAFGPERPTRQVRRWLKDSLAFTPVSHRLPAQYLGAAVGSSRWGLAWMSRPGFSLAPGLPDPRSALIVPGNQRVRLLSFHAGTTRVWAKSGFERHGMLTEVSVRGGAQRGPFVPITAHGPEGAWFEEALIDGLVLPRVPPWVRTRDVLSDVLRRLDEWSSVDGETLSARSYADQLRGIASELMVRVKSRHPTSLEALGTLTLERLCRGAARLGTAEVCRTHGDLQPGNIMLQRAGAAGVVLDWEHSRRRFRHYDRLVLGLATRSGRGQRTRVQQFLQGRSYFPLDELPRSAAWRRGAVALLALEELVWHLRESLSGPYRAAPRGLGSTIRFASWAADTFGGH